MNRKITNNYEKKFLQEYPFMPFGSMMNSFGLINHGKGRFLKMSAEDFIKEAKKIFEASREVVNRQFEEIGLDEQGAGTIQVAGEDPKF